MEKVRDWNISRQLWWGHQIPAYCYAEGVNDFVVAKTAKEALELAKEKTGNQDLQLTDLRQESDVLDTWFSSWLWPISVFDGIRHPDNKEINYYYPTNDLVTAPEILFFWVARMIISGYEYRGEKPFKNVYLTGIVRDKLGRKMSKSLGNSPDPIKLMKKYGDDGVRVGMLLTSPAGNDLPGDIDGCQQGRNFTNKIWNAFRLVKQWEVDAALAQPQSSKVAIDWYQAKFQQVLEQTEQSYDKYRLSEALMRIYKLVWDDFSSWFLEMVKPKYQRPIDAVTYKTVVGFFEDNLKLLHPFMPFISEEIWQAFSERAPEKAMIITAYPKQKTYNKNLLQEFDIAIEVITNIRAIRK